MVAGGLEVQMWASMVRLIEDMRVAKATVSSAMSNIEGAVSKAKYALGALGIGLSGAYFVSLVKGSIDAADHLNDLRKSLDMTADELSGLKLLAQQSGTDLDGLAKAVNKMSVEMGKAPEKFRAVGITAKDNIGALKQVADLFNSLTDVQQRNALAQSIFGKSWAEIAPALSEGSRGIQDAVDKGKLLSGQTQKMAEEADKFNDRMVELNATLASTRHRAVAELLPGMNDIAKAMQEAAKEGGLLLTVWVGLGGAMAHLLGLTDSQKLAKRLAEINEQLAIATKQMEGGTLKSGGTSQAGVFSWLLPDVKLGEQALARLSETVKRLNAEKAMLEKPALDAEKAKAAAAQRTAQEKKDADEKAKLFLDWEKRQAAMKSAAEKASADRKRLLDMDAKNEEASWEARVKAAQEYNDMMTGMSPEEWQQKRRLFDEQERGFAESRARFIESENEEREALHEASLKATIEARKKMLEAEKKTNDERLREWERLWGTVESTGKQVFVNLFSQGKSSFEGIGKALKASIIDMLYQLTVRRWIVNIGASVAGSMGISGAASAAGGGSLLESGASMFNTGSSLYSAGSSLYAGGTSGLLYGTGMAGGATLMEAGGAVAANYGAYSAASLSSVAAAEGLTVAAGAGGVGAGATAALAAIPVYGWVALAALAVAAYLGSQDNDNAEPAGAPGRFFSSFTGSQAGLLSSGGYSYMGERKDGGQYSGAVAANAAMQQQLDSSIKMLFDEYRKTAQAAGLSTGGLDQQILVAQREGATVQQAYQASLAGLSDELARAVIPNIESFRRVGESLEQTFRRLTSESIGAKQAIEAQIAAMDAQGRAMMIQLLEERGLVVQAREATRAMELEAAGGNLFGLQRQIHDAQDVSRWVAIAYGQAAELAKAFQKEAGALSQMASTWHDAAAGLRAYGATLTGAGGQMSYGAAARAFGSVASRARLGDLDAIGQLPEVGEQFRLASLASSGSSLAYSRDVARIGATVGSAATLAERQESVALQQLETMTTQVESLIDVNESVQSVVDGLRQMNGVIAELIRINDESGRQSKRAADVLEQVTLGSLSVRTTAA